MWPTPILNIGDMHLKEPTIRIENLNTQTVIVPDRAELDTQILFRLCRVEFK